MSANAEALPAAAAPAAGTANPWLIAVVVALAVFMEVLDTTIANVALPYIAGGLGVSQDEASWVVTTYLVPRRGVSGTQQAAFDTPRRGGMGSP